MEEKQRKLEEKEITELTEKQQIEIEQAAAVANKYKSARLRRRLDPYHNSTN